MLTTIIILSVLLIVLIIFVLILYGQTEDLKYELEQTIVDLDQKKIESLRFELNPHTFKNTLMTVEGMAKRTLRSVQGLSGISDYMLYDSKNEYVELNKELLFLSDYVELHKPMLNSVVQVRVSIDLDMDQHYSKPKQIAPLIFAHFIENAFKHGDKESHDAFFEVQVIKHSDDELIYSVRNKIGKRIPERKGGLGTTNFLTLLKARYQDRHQMDTNIKEGIFTANLKLKLHDRL